jgi:Na+/melibiose symporter-like transporter
VKLWDAVNDVIFGTLIDKVKFKKSGKFIPWLRISLPVILVATLLLFGIPQDLGIGEKLIWLAVAYIIFDTGYTISDVPVYGLVTTMTNSQSERTDLMAKSRITSYSGALLVLGLGFILPSEQVGISFTTISQIIVALALVTMIWLCIYGKEHLVSDRQKEDTYTVRQMFHYFSKNKYLFIFFGGLFFFAGFTTAQSVLQFATFYLFDSAMLATVVAAIAFVPAVILSFFLPAMLRRFDKHRMIMFFAVAFFVLSAIIWAVGPNLTPHLVLSVLRGFALGGVTVLQFMFTPDCAEYGQYKTGIEAKGITFAVQTFTMKLTAAVSASLGIAVLGIFGWQSVVAESFAELAALGVTQSDTAMGALWAVYSLIPAIGGGLATLLWTRYKLKVGDVQLMAQLNKGEITREECDAKLSKKY